MEHEAALNDDFNISTPTSTTVLELAQLIWEKLRPGTEFRWVSDTPFEHDVQRRVPSVAKARDILGFEATTGLSEMLDEVIPWIEAAVADGTI
jgi:nucleoside-diphosphate-sugar epimerase